MAATPRDQGAISGQNLLSAAAQILVAAETSRLRANREVMPFAVLGAKLPTDPSGDDPMGPRPADTGIRHPSPAPVRIGGHVVHRRRRRWCHGSGPGASLGQELAHPCADADEIRRILGAAQAPWSGLGDLAASLPVPGSTAITGSAPTGTGSDVVTASPAS